VLHGRPGTRQRPASLLVSDLSRGQEAPGPYWGERRALQRYSNGEPPRNAAERQRFARFDQELADVGYAAHRPDGSRSRTGNSTGPTPTAGSTPHRERGGLPGSAHSSPGIWEQGQRSADGQQRQAQVKRDSRQGHDPRTFCLLGRAMLWTAERNMEQDALVASMCQRPDEVPCERNVVLLGGLPPADKIGALAQVDIDHTRCLPLRGLDRSWAGRRGIRGRQAAWWHPAQRPKVPLVVALAPGRRLPGQSEWDW